MWYACYSLSGEIKQYYVTDERSVKLCNPQKSRMTDCKVEFRSVPYNRLVTLFIYGHAVSENGPNTWTIMKIFIFFAHH